MPKSGSDHILPSPIDLPAMPPKEDWESELQFYSAPRKTGYGAWVDLPNRDERVAGYKGAADDGKEEEVIKTLDEGDIALLKTYVGVALASLAFGRVLTRSERVLSERCRAKVPTPRS